MELFDFGPGFEFEYNEAREFQSVDTFFGAFDRRYNSLAKFYREFEFVFDYDKVEKYIKDEIPNFPLFLKILKLDFPKNSDEMAMFIYQIDILSEIEFSKDPAQIEPLVEKYPELIDYVMNESLDEQQCHFDSFMIVRAKDLSYEQRKLCCLFFLADECIFRFKNMNYRKMIKESLISNKMDEVLSA